MLLQSACKNINAATGDLDDSDNDDDDNTGIDDG